MAQESFKRRCEYCSVYAIKKGCQKLATFLVYRFVNSYCLTNFPFVVPSLDVTT